MKLGGWLCLLVISASTPSAMAAEPSVTDVQVVNVHAGINRIPHFAADGRTATVIQGWRGNGNAHGYNVFLVLLPSAEGMPLGVVDRIDSESDVLRDDPFDGERTLGTVLFARATLAGVRQTVLIAAHLDESQSGVLADHATATVNVYRLVKSDGQIGTTPDYFELAWSTQTTARYCNVDLALASALSIPLPKDYDAPNKKDGCFD